MMRRLWKATFYTACAVLLLLLGAYVYLFHLGGLVSITARRIDSLLPADAPVHVDIGDVSGDLLSGVIVRDIVVYYEDSVTMYPLLTLPRLEAGYAVSDLWRKKYVLDYLRLDHLHVTIVRDSLGQLLLPTLPAAGSAPSEGPSFSVDEFILNDASVTYIHAADTSTFRDIIVWAALSGSAGTYAVDLERMNVTSDKENMRLEATGGRVTYSDRRFVFEDASLISGQARARLSGNVLLEKTPAGSISVVADNVDLAELTRHLGPSLTGIVDLNAEVSFADGKLTGTADAAGRFMMADFDNLHCDFEYADRRLLLDTLYGSILSGCVIDGYGTVDFAAKPATYDLQADILNFNLESLIPETFHSNLNGNLALSGSSFRSADLALDISVDLFESSFDEYPMHEASGRFMVTTDSITFADSFHVSYFENDFYATGTITYSNDVNLRVAVDLAGLDRYRGKLFIDQPGGRGYAEATLSGRTADPDLAGYFVSDSVWIYGLYADSLYASIDVRRFLTAKKGSVVVDVFRGRAWEIPYDTGRVKVTVDSNLVHLDSAFVAGGVKRLVATGVLDHGAYPQDLRLDTLALTLFGQQFHNRDPIHVGIDSNGFDFIQAAIGNHDAGLSVQGRADYDESMDLQLSIRRLPLAPWINLFDTGYAVAGLLSCDGRLAGNFLSPRLDLRGRVDSLVYRDLLLGMLSAVMAYDDGVLRLDTVSLESGPGEYFASGFLHANLAMARNVGQRLPDLPLDITLTARDQRFDLVSLLMPSVEKLDGDFWMNIHLSGTPHSPHLEGQAFMKNARLKYFDLEHPIFADSAGAVMSDNRIIFDRIELYTTRDKRRGSRSKRYAYVEGELVAKTLDSLYYDLDVSLPKEFPFSYELDDIKGEVEGELHVEGDSPPTVTGDLNLISTKYQVSFAGPDEGSPVMMALSGEDSWDLDISIDILSNFYIENEDIDAEFAGLINVTREQGNYRFAGEMRILRGRGFLVDKTFRLEPGSSVIFEGSDTLNPRLDIIGWTRIAVARSETELEDEGAPREIELGIHVTGTLETPDIQPVAGSDFAREDILPLIFANYYSGEDVSTSGQIERRLFGLGYSQVSQFGARQLGQIGVETFEIDPVYGEEVDPWNARITLGFYTGPSLYVYGRSTLSGQTRQEVGFEYRLNKAFHVEGRRDEEELYQLNLKFHWEF